MLAAAVAAEAPPEDLRAQLLDLAETHNFTLKNADRIKDGASRRTRGDLEQQLKHLLHGYDYVVVHGPDGAIESLHVNGVSAHAAVASAAAPGQGASTLSSAEPQPPAQVPSTPSRQAHRVSLEWEGDSYVVSALLFGETGTRLRSTLEVALEEGAVLLPASMSSALGFDSEALDDAWTESLHGRLRVKVGKLKAIWLGGTASRNVEVAFVDDALLGGRGILGMAAYRGFGVRIDDAREELLLTPE